MNNVKLAVIMPNYNKALYIKEALDSLDKQTYKDFDILICDDGSTDDSREILQNYKGTKDITIYHNDYNMGVSYTLNRLVDIIKSRGYTHFYIMASDDKIDSTLIGKLVSMIDNEYDFYTCHAKMYGLEDDIFYSQEILTWDKFRTSSPLLTTGIYSVKMWHDLGGRREDWKLTHDYEFFVRMFKNGYKHKVLNEILYYWRNYQGQLSRSIADDIDLRRKAFEVNGIDW